LTTRLLALKVDVDTLRGTQEGVPRLIEVLRKYEAGASFLFSLGPDNTGRALRRVFRRGFLSKVSRTSVLEHYGLKTLSYGVFLPGPDIGVKAADVMRATRAAGFECGVHAWDHVKWHDQVRAASSEWTIREWTLAQQRFREVFGYSAQVCGAAGWQINETTVRLQASAKIEYVSDGRGPRPYRILLNDQVVGPVQYPSTLPTLDELIGRDGIDAQNCHEHVLQLTHSAPSSLPQVFTLHAELEGGKWLGIFERLLAGWRTQGFELLDLRGLHQRWQQREIGAQTLQWGTVPGRAGELLISR
jgi:undecaprenyl phosphate-alpha-L-ara4FN deformylase